ncbi:hypothetical protein Patl1_15742 [Pistacia atlantica]|uniref:Uncharacterized protein n=1 Tax=Pistacia atlantica TaxID=434234 RepID=A0ACC1BAL8_9ROSI|nr:hypothetical protein Patl1_15742 [Pistacia atlantica]
MDSNTSAVWRPNVSTAPAPSNQAIQHPIYPTHPSLPPISGSSQGHWLQHPQTGVMLGRLFRHVPLFILLPFFCRHLACLVFLLHQMILYLLVFLLWQMLSSAASGQQVVGASGMQTEPPSGIDNRERVHAFDAKEGSAADKVSVQPTPVSMDYLVGTDWALVTTNDGRKYYYNSKTKV